MRTRLLSLLSAAGVALVFGAAAASAQGTGSTICKDGSRSAVTGKGACSSHGGVDAKATEAARKAATKVAKTETKAADKAAKTETKAATKVAKTESKAATKVAKAEDKAAKMVKCTDGSMSKGGRGACSHHGGIAK